MVKNCSWVVLVFLFAAGCAAPTPTPPNQYYYRIYVDKNPESDRLPHLDGVLVVRRFLSDGLVGERSLVYRAGDNDDPLLQYDYHHWTDSPTRMLPEQLVPYLRRANVAEQVVTSDIYVNSQFELLGSVRRLEQIRGSSPRVVVELEFVLTESSRTKPNWVRIYSTEVMSSNESIVSAIEAFNRAISTIFAELVHDLPASW